ncbi:OmpA/MotB family protein [Glaciibacter sp. 2TAF33]|uniref:OmpA/MotB family protein n=1 Tax=Glaciibacter sp. 2TAF33 TaxID=3233015 RepID=UPI003F8E4681
MSARPRRRKLGESEDEHPDERWMASYMDMVTVLMCMFIVLFAMSTVDENKFKALANSLATGFGSTDVNKIDTAGVVVRPDLVDPLAAGFAAVDTRTDVEVARAEIDDLTALREHIRSNLQQNGVENLVQFKIDQRGLTIGLIGSETFFQPDRADLSPQAIVVLDSMAPLLAPDARDISVEGHADKHGRTVNFPTDWELSSGRATQVLRRLVEQGGVPQEHVGAVGYGAARPAATGDALEDMAQNRRVDVVVLSKLPDSVRALIPGLLESLNAPGAPPASVPAATTPEVAAPKPAAPKPAAPGPAGGR